MNVSKYAMIQLHATRSESVATNEWKTSRFQTLLLMRSFTVFLFDFISWKRLRFFVFSSSSLIKRWWLSVRVVRCFAFSNEKKVEYLKIRMQTRLPTFGRFQDALSFSWPYLFWLVVSDYEKHMKWYLCIVFDRDNLDNSRTIQLRCFQWYWSGMRNNMTWFSSAPKIQTKWNVWETSSMWMFRLTLPRTIDNQFSICFIFSKSVANQTKSIWWAVVFFRWNHDFIVNETISGRFSL